MKSIGRGTPYCAQPLEPRRTYARKWAGSSPFRVRAAEVPSNEGTAVPGTLGGS
jgi:hypothetical protein